MSKFEVIVVMRAKPGREAALRENLAALVAPSRQEEGNERYELYGDAQDAGRFILLESWASVEARDRHHNHGPHIQHFHANGDKDVESREQIYVLTKIA